MASTSSFEIYVIYRISRTPHMKLALENERTVSFSEMLRLLTHIPPTYGGRHLATSAPLAAMRDFTWVSNRSCNNRSTPVTARYHWYLAGTVPALQIFTRPSTTSITPFQKYQYCWEPFSSIQTICNQCEVIVWMAVHDLNSKLQSLHSLITLLKRSHEYVWIGERSRNFADLTPWQDPKWKLSSTIQAWIQCIVYIVGCFWKDTLQQQQK